MPDPHIRPASQDDAPAIAALLAELGHPTAAAVIPRRLEGLRAEGAAAFVACDADGHVLGFFSIARLAVVHGDGPVALITALVVAESARGGGVGRRMVDAARDWARDAGCVRLLVTSAERRADAHAFYEACGMPYTGRRFACDQSSPSRRHRRRVVNSGHTGKSGHLQCV
jgi:GNAT superfamily N-acetyltransferase